jgi:hypothetical protein
MAFGSHHCGEVHCCCTNDIVVRIVLITTIVIYKFELECLGLFEVKVNINSCLEVWVESIFDKLSASDFKPLFSILGFL